MKKIIFFFLLFTVILNAQQWPIDVETPTFVDPGIAHFEFGIAHIRNQSYPLGGIDGNLTKIGNLNFAFSYDGNVELQFDGTLLNLLDIRHRFQAFNSSVTTTNNLTGDVGDLTLWTKFRLLNEYSRGIGTAIRFGVQLPNASNESGLGIDEMNFYSSFLLQKHFAGLWTFNFGFGILSDPVNLSSQHDVIIYGLEYSVPINENTFILIQTAGRKGHEGQGIYKLANGKIGFNTIYGDLNVRFLSIFNFTPSDNAYGAEISVGYNFKILSKE
jgi:hypothetical protein